MFQCSHATTELANYASRTRVERAEMLSIFMCYALGGLIQAFAAGRDTVRSLIGRVAGAR